MQPWFFMQRRGVVAKNNINYSFNLAA